MSVDHSRIPKGEAIPQTVESLQKVMAGDALVMEVQSLTIRRLRNQNAKLLKKLAAARAK